jgi:hypothetical protein
LEPFEDLNRGSNSRRRVKLFKLQIKKNIMRESQGQGDTSSISKDSCGSIPFKI